jgi:hypothetical protein
MHAPQRVHLSLSMACAFFFSPLIAPTGQTRLQSVQPVHFSASML